MEQDWSLHDLVRSFGLCRTYSGYKYLIHALELIREEPERLELVTKRLYPDVARKFGVTPGGVDAALRTMARACWQNTPEQFWGAGVCAEDSVSVKEFLRRLHKLDCRRRQEASSKR